MAERVAVFGSCVSRDTLEYADPSHCDLHAYVARQSLASAFAPKRAEWAQLEPTALTSRFQRTALARDLQGRYSQILGASGDVDLVLMDLVDERGGVIVLADGTSLTKSLELTRSGLLDVVGDHQWFKFGSDEHFTAWKEGLDMLVDGLSQAHLSEKVVFVKNHWASVSREGLTFPFNESRLDPVTVNELSARYWNAIAATGLKMIVVPSGLCVTTSAHRWGVAPFHYVDEFYRYILAELRSLGHDLNPSPRGSTHPVATVTHHGLSWVVAGTTLEDHIFKDLQDGRPYEEELLASSAPFVSPGDVIIDVGANIGNHAAFWAVVCAADVYAFEPQDSCVGALEETVRLNGLERSIYIRAFGLGRETKTARTESPESANVGASVLVEDDGGSVLVRALDDVLLPAPQSVRMIKVDVEGMELDVLMGADRIVRDHRPILIVECQDDAAYAAVEDWVAERGYRLTEAFNATPTYMFIHEDFSYPARYPALSHMQDVTARTSRRSVLNRNLARTQWRVLGEHRRRLDTLAGSSSTADEGQQSPGTDA